MDPTMIEMFGLSDADLVKPEPEPTQWSAPFWEAAREHRLILRRCVSCGTYQHPPYPSCVECNAESFEWVNAAGTATLYAYTVNHFAVPFAFWDDMPYVTAVVELAEGVRMISNIVECADGVLHTGMDLEIVFDDVSDRFTLPKWKPVRQEAR